MVALPAPIASSLSQSHPGFAVVRCVVLPFGLGLVLPLLASTLPFSRAPLGLRVPLTTGEITRGHHLLILEQDRPAAYAGWAECSLEQGARFLGVEGIRALDPELRHGEAMAILTTIATSSAAMTVLKTAMRATYPGRRYFGRRVHADQKGQRVTASGGIIVPLVAMRSPAT
jgi:hemolysin-activating ACP:hemolysin acyltransferase